MSKELQTRILSSFILIPISFYFVLKGSYFFIYFLLFCFAVTAYEWHMMTKKKNYQIFGFLFLIFSFYSTYAIRNNFNDESLIFFTIILITCISTDIGGYIFGKIFKGPKLTKISPKKTYAGVFGGYFLSIINANFFFNYLLSYKKIFIENTIELFFIIFII